MRFLGRALHRAYSKEHNGKAPPNFRGVWDNDFEVSDEEARASASEARAWCKRRVAERCLFGVDLNPTAVQLAQVSLWIESLVADRPLSYFEHHVRCGNSLVGSWLERIGDPPLPEMKPKPRPGELDIFVHDVETRIREAAKIRALIDLGGDVGAVEPESVNEQTYKADRKREAEMLIAGARLLFDLRSASAFLPQIWEEWPTLCGFVSDPVKLETYGRARPWWDAFRQIQQRDRFFHWELEFPEVFLRESAGFDAVLGNPPWDKVLPTKHEFYARYDVVIRAFKGNDLERRIRELDRELPGIADEFRRYQDRTITTAHFLRHGGDFPLSRGASQAAHEDVSKYFLDRAVRITRLHGCVGMVVPGVVYNGDGCVGIRKYLLRETTIVRFYSFENRKKIFPIHAMYKFVNLAFRKGLKGDVFEAAFMRHDLAELQSEGTTPWMVRLTRQEIEELSPDTFALLEYRGPIDQAIVHRMYRGRPRLGSESGNGWGATLITDRSRLQIYNVARDKDLWTDPETGRAYTVTGVLGTARESLPDALRDMLEKGFHPVYEGKQIDQYLVGIKPVRWWLSALQAETKHGRRPRQEPLLVIRETASNTNERTCIAAVLPAGSCAAHTVTGVLPTRVDPVAASVVLNSFVFDYALRLRTAGTHVSFTYLRPMPVPPAEAASRLPGVQTQVTWESHVEHVTQIHEIWPLLWAAERAVAEVYNLGPGEFEHILGSFPVYARKRPEFFSYLKQQLAAWKAERTESEAGRQAVSPTDRATPVR
jgi:hypothetical protein